MSNSKPKVLFFMHMPPPVHGAAQMGQYIHDSKLINESFNCRYFNLSASSNVNEVGHFSVKKILFLFTSIFRMIKIVNQWKPDLVYTTPTTDGLGFYRDFFTILILKKKFCKIVVHFHNRPNKHFSEKWYNKKLYAKFFNGIKVIFLSHRLVPEFSSYLASDQLFICPNGIFAPPLKKNYNIRDEKYTFLFLSNMMIEKGVYVLLQACKILKKKGYKFRCDLVGKWSDIQPSDFEKERQHELLNENIFAHGAKYGCEKVSFFCNSDCFVFPTYYSGEAFPLVVLEAMSFSLPVISTNIAGIPDIVENGKNGFCIEPQNAEKLAETMAWMIDHPEDGKRMGQNGYKIFEEKFTLEKFESNICSLLQECLKR